MTALSCQETGLPGRYRSTLLSLLLGLGFGCVGESSYFGYG